MPQDFHGDVARIKIRSRLRKTRVSDGRLEDTSTHLGVTSTRGGDCEPLLFHMNVYKILRQVMRVVWASGKALNKIRKKSLSILANLFIFLSRVKHRCSGGVPQSWAARTSLKHLM